jgi:hypothetical protein
VGVDRVEQRKADRVVASIDENDYSTTIESCLIMPTREERTKQDYLQSLQEEDFITNQSFTLV